jgi:hypothetical protein
MPLEIFKKNNPEKNWLFLTHKSWQVSPSSRARIDSPNKIRMPSHDEGGNARMPAQAVFRRVQQGNTE